MTRAQLQKLALDLPEPDRLDLAQTLVDSVDAHADIPDWHRLILRERLAEAKANPGQSIPWAEARRRVFSS